MEFFSNEGARTGLFFGATSGVITTIGLIVGLNSGTRSIIAVIVLSHYIGAWVANTFG